MKASITFPDPDQQVAFLKAKASFGPAYSELQDTQLDFDIRRATPGAKKYDYDEHCILLGSGPDIFNKAKAGITQWRMFPEGWTRVYPTPAPIIEGQQVAVFFRLLGLWWWNSSEIVYTIDEEHRFGFAYGTLPGHVENGEERFLVEMDTDGKVWYSIKAFSRPAYRLVQLAYPFARSQQKRFVRNSMQQMKQWVEQQSGSSIS